MVYLGPYHPEKPDPDCDCDQCKVAHLTDDDRTWLEAHGWRDPSKLSDAEIVEKLIGQRKR